MSKKPAQPVYPSTKIITLLESESQVDNHKNGVFNVNLNEQVVLKEGDSIELDKVFIDTTKSEETLFDGYFAK